MNKKFSALLTLSLILTIGIYLMTSQIYHLKEIYDGRPQEIIVTNITNDSVKIYWKGDNSVSPVLKYKEESSTGLYKSAETISFRDNTSDLKIYKSTVTDLDPNTEYVFEIEIDEYTWKKNDENNLWSFNTKNISDNPELPNIASGSSHPMELILLEKDGEKYMLDTQYHGTWAMDIGEGNDFETVKYGNYMLDENLQQLASSFGIKKAFASTGANCRTGSSAEYSDAPKSTFVKVANNWTSCKGNYGEECYSDVVCRASSKNVDPAFALVSWLRESAASNYGYNSGVQDFGINGAGIPAVNFDKQIDHYLYLISGIENYITNPNFYTSCTYAEARQYAQMVAPNRDPRLIIYGALYWTGNPCNVDKGLEYMSTSFTVYQWLTGREMTWEGITKATNIPGCSFTGTNTEYKACDGTSTTSSSSSSSGSSSNSSNTQTNTTGTLQCGQNNCVTDADCAGWESGDYECDETSSHNPADQYCRLIKCPDGQQISEDGCSCEKAEEYTLELVEGVNFITLEANPFSGSQKVTAKSLMNSNSSILTIGEYLGGSWENIVTRKDGQINGEDFNLQGGRAYLIIMSKERNLDYYGIGKSSRDISSLKGWTLVPTDLIGENSAESIITDYEDLNINQIAVWDNPTGMFENLAKDVDGSFYGNNIYLSGIDSIFIRIE